MSAQRQASSASQTPHLSPAELSYLYTSLSLPNAPIRPDGRSATQFRPLAAETDVLPGANGSARVGFADGTQAIVGVKAEVEKTALGSETTAAAAAAGDNDAGDGGEGQAPGQGHGSWVQMSIEIPGFRDDDALPVFLAEMMREPLVESVSDGSGKGSDGGMTGGLKGRLVINRRWHWRLYIDVFLPLLLDSFSCLCGVLTCMTGSPPFATPLLSPPATLFNDTPRATLDETPETEIAGRGGSFLR